MFRKIRMALLCFLVCLLPTALVGVDLFPNEETCFYVEKTSVTAPMLQRGEEWNLILKGFTGETVRFNGDQTEEILDRLDAKVLWIERVDGIVHYFCSSPKIEQKKLIGGREVNFELAFFGDETKLGIPILFGSY